MKKCDDCIHIPMCEFCYNFITGNKLDAEGLCKVKNIKVEFEQGENCKDFDCRRNHSDIQVKEKDVNS